MSYVGTSSEMFHHKIRQGWSSTTIGALLDVYKLSFELLTFFLSVNVINHMIWRFHIWLCRGMFLSKVRGKRDRAINAQTPAHSLLSTKRRNPRKNALKQTNERVWTNKRVCTIKRRKDAMSAFLNRSKRGRVEALALLFRAKTFPSCGPSNGPLRKSS